MKGYKIGINEDTVECVLIELEVPEEYPGAIIYGYEPGIGGLLFYSDDKTHHRTKQYRANVVRVLDIRKIKNGTIEHVESAFSLYDHNFCYRIGEIVFPDAFELDPYWACTHGIHFFGNTADAICYTKDRWAQHQHIQIKLNVASNKWKEYLNAKYPKLEYIKADTK